MYIEDHILSLIGFIDWLFVKRMAFSSPYSLSLYVYIYIYIRITSSFWKLRDVQLFDGSKSKWTLLENEYIYGNQFGELPKEFK